MSKTLALVALAGLNLKAGTQFREGLNEEAVKGYTQTYKEWKAANINGVDGKPLAEPPTMDKWSKCPLPAITVFETDADGTINADGFHRVKAGKAAGLDMLPAEVKKGTKMDAIIFALGANAAHGVQLTNADKQNKLKAAVKIEDLNKLSNNALAFRLGLSEFFVRTNRPAGATPAVVTTAAGKTMNVKNVGKKGGNSAKKKAAEKKASKSGKKGNTAATPAAGTPASGQTAEEAALAGALGEGGGEGGGTTPPPGKAFDTETESALTRICSEVTKGGVADGVALEKSIRGGSIEISTRDIRDLAKSSPERICLAYPLVFGEKRMKPAAAFGFLDKIPDAGTKLEHFINLTVARRGVVVETVENVAADPESGYMVIVVPRKGHEVLRNVPLGSFFVVSAANKAAALAAIKEA